MKIIFLDVFAVIALIASQPKEPFLENRILAIPKRQSEADILMAIGDAADTVFAPAVGAAARLIVRQIFPDVSIRAVVLAYRAPLAVGYLRSPAFPVQLAPALLF